MQTPSETFVTTDFQIAAFLLSQGLKLLSIDRTNPHNPRQAQFLFSDTRDRPRLIEEFWSDEVLVSPKKLFLAQKEIKGQLYTDSLT